MKCGVFSFLLLLSSAQQIESRSASSSPVERVVDLLKTLKTSIEQDGERELQLYNKYACWTDKVLKLKADAIDAAKAKSKETARRILQLKGEIATLASEIAKLENQIAANEQIQEEAQAVRQKENGAFMAETSELKEAINALERAINVLKEGTSAALLQTRTAGVAAVRSALQALPERSSVHLKPDATALLTTFMNDGTAANYAPQSVTVQGILRDMYDTFTEDLESATQAEAQANAKYEGLIYKLQQQVKGWKEDIAEREEKKAKAETDLADATTLYDQLQAQIKADIDFFDEVKASGLAKSTDWSERKRLRSDEIDGVDKALKILSTDDARTLFDTAIKAGKATPAPPASLLQVTSHNAEAASVAMARAYNLVKTQAQVSKSVRLGELAVEIRTAKVGHFDAVIAAIDNMIAALRMEDEDDIKKRDQCKDEYQTTDSSIADLKWKIKVNIATIEKLEDQIAKNEAEKAQTIQDIKDVERQMSEMTSVRKQENADFLHSKTEDEDSISLLQAATEAFSKYYTENNITLGPIQASIKEDLALAQQGPDFEISQWQAPEANFKDMGHHKNEAKDIVSILSYITEDLYDEIRVAQQAEEDAQLRYEAAMKAAEQLKSDLIDRKNALSKEIASDQALKAAENRDKDHNEAELKDDVTYRKSITPDCDWIIGAFEERARKRVAELEGLAGAKDFLAGAQEAAFVQGNAHKKSSFLRASHN